MLNAKNPSTCTPLLSGTSLCAINLAECTCVTDRQRQTDRGTEINITIGGTAHTVKDKAE